MKWTLNEHTTLIEDTVADLNEDADRKPLTLAIDEREGTTRYTITNADDPSNPKITHITARNLTGRFDNEFYENTLKHLFGPKRDWPRRLKDWDRGRPLLTRAAEARRIENAAEAARQTEKVATRINLPNLDLAPADSSQPVPKPEPAAVPVTTKIARAAANVLSGWAMYLDREKQVFTRGPVQVLDINDFFIGEITEITIPEKEWVAPLPDVDVKAIEESGPPTNVDSVISSATNDIDNAVAEDSSLIIASRVNSEASLEPDAETPLPTAAISSTIPLPDSTLIASHEAELPAVPLTDIITEDALPPSAGPETPEPNKEDPPPPKPLTGFALFAARERIIKAVAPVAPAQVEPPAEPPSVQEGSVPSPSPKRRKKPIEQNLPPVRHMVVSGIIEQTDTLPEAAAKVTALLNAHPAVVAKAGTYDLPQATVSFFLSRPNDAFTNGAVSISLSAYRIWQAVDEYNQANGQERISVNAFWGNDGYPAEKPSLQIGRAIYEKNIIPILDRHENRHFQSIKQINAALGLGSEAFSLFVTGLQYAYVREDRESAAGMTLEDAIQSPIVVRSQPLQALMNLFGVEDSAEIVSRVDWHHAVETLPTEGAKNSSFVPGPAFEIEKLSPESRSVMARILESGFKSIEDLRKTMNERLNLATPLLPVKSYQLLISNLYRAITDRRAFGRWDNGSEGVLYRRITEVVNERREQSGLKSFTTSGLFGINMGTISAMQVLKSQATNNFLEILSRGDNRALLTVQRIATKVGLKTDDVNDVFYSLHTAYTADEDGAIVADPRLATLAKGLGCETTELIPHALWRQAVALKPQDDSEADWGTTDIIGPPSEPIMVPTNLILIEAVPEHGFPAEFYNAAVKVRNEEEHRASTDRPRASILSVLRQVAEVFEDNPNAVIDALVTPTPVDPAPDPVNDDGAAPAAIPAFEPESAQVVPPQAQPVPDAAPEADAISEPSTATQEAPVLTDDAEQKQVVADFMGAAVEVFVLYRSFHSPDMAVELSALDRVEGLSRKSAVVDVHDEKSVGTTEAAKKDGRIAMVTRDLGLDSVEETLAIIDDLKSRLVRTASSYAGIEVKEEFVMNALRVYHKEITGRVLAIRWLQNGRDETHDAATGTSLPRTLTAPEVKGVRERFFASLAARLEGKSDLAV